MNEFTQPSFLHSSNIYEVNTRQYTPEGTFNAFIKHLPRLKKMGIEILWFMPIYPIGAINRKGSLGSYYSIKDFTAVNPEFGTLNDFKILVDEIHKYGMKIILDWVANHAAWDNAWTISHPDFFLQDDLGNFQSPYDWTDVIQINHNSKEQQEAMINAMAYWITEFNIDGFRADLAHLTPLSFWKNARQHLEKKKKELIWLAETEEINYHEAFDISYTWKWMHATEAFVKDRHDPDMLKNVLAAASSEFTNYMRMYFTSNHDENSWNGTEYEKYGIFLNAFTVFSFTYNHAVPLIYSGQELPNKKRLKFFDKDVIEWNENISHENFYKILLDYRHREPLFKVRDNEGFAIIETSLPLLVYQKISNENCMIVILNLGKENIESEIYLSQTQGNYRNIFTSQIHNIINTIFIILEPGGHIVLEKINE